MRLAYQLIELNMSMPLKGQTFLVTGVTCGVGPAIVERLALEGARPIIHYWCGEGAAQKLLARIGGSGMALQANLADDSGSFALWQEAVASVGRINGLINNASAHLPVSIDSSVEDWQLLGRGNSNLIFRDCRSL